MMRPGDDPHDEIMLDVPPIYGARGEEYQVEPDPPARGPVPAAIAIIVAVLLIMWWL